MGRWQTEGHAFAVVIRCFAMADGTSVQSVRLRARQATFSARTIASGALSRHNFRKGHRIHHGYTSHGFRVEGLGLRACFERAAPTELPMVLSSITVACGPGLAACFCHRLQALCGTLNPKPKP